MSTTPYPLLSPVPGERLFARLKVRHADQVMRLAWPTVLAMMSHTLMWTVDTIFLGHVSSVALGAAGLGGILTWTAYSLANNLSRISGTFVAQAHGRGDDAAIGDYTWQGLYVAVVTGILLQLFGYFSYLLLPLTHNPADIQALTYDYVKWRTASATLTQVGFCFTGFFQGRQRVHAPMWAGMAGNVTNVVLDLWLIFGWQGVNVGGHRWLAMSPQGVAGAAIATSISVAVSTAVLVVAALWPAENRQRFRIHRPRKPDPARIGHILRIGAPAAWENFVDMSGFLVFTAVVGTTGAVALAANQIGMQLISFGFMPTWGITIAGSVLVGNWIGAGRPDQAAAYARQVYKVGGYYAIGLAVVMVALRHHLFGIFTSDPLVLQHGPRLILLLAPFQICDGMRMISIGVLQGAGDTRFPMVASMIVLWGGFIPVTWASVVLGGGDVTTAWVVGTAIYAVQALVMYLRFRSGVWQRVKIFS
jgi:MATE family multidrug resistance protein